MALRAGVALASARVADQFSLACHGRAGREAFEAHVVRRIDGLLVEFGEKNMSNGADDILGSAFDEIGEADEDFTFAQADGCVQRCEAAEAHGKRRHRRSRAQNTIFLLKYGDQMSSHQV